MKHSVKRLLQPEPRCTERGGYERRQRCGLQRLAACLFAAVLLVQGTACVSSSKHKEVVAERDALAKAEAELGERAGYLEVSNSSLEAERVRLYDELEDLRLAREALAAERATLERDVERLNENENELSERLDNASAALSAATAEVGNLKSTYQGLVDDLEMELQQGALEIEQLRSGLRVAVSDEILFSSGSARLDPDGVALLEKVSANIKELDYAIDVEGHTDDRRISGRLKKRFASNWELAGARAARVVRLFESAGIDGARLQAISRASHAPVASNEDAQGRSMNRRIEILLRPRESQQAEEAPEGEKTDTTPSAAPDTPVSDES